MKYFIVISCFLSIGFISAVAQIQAVTEQPKKNPEIENLDKWGTLNSYVTPITDQQVEDFCKYIEKNGVTHKSELNEDVALYKIRTAQLLYKQCEDFDQKKKLVDLMLNMFKEIQVTRDALGVDPLSRTESWLYVDSSAPRKDPSEFKDLKEQMTEGQRRLNESNSRRNKLSNKIGNLSTIHAYLHRAVTHHMQIKLEGISPTLERSPAEKARTKDFLEKQAAAAGHKKPETKAHDK